MLEHIEFKNVSHEYPQQKQISLKVLNEVNFSIKKGQFIAVVGPSGCGKSTLLKLLSGLSSPTFGTVKKYGVTIDGPQSDVGIVFQKPNLLPWKNILENVCFPALHQNGRITEKDKTKAKELLDLVGLADFATQMPSQLSGGMQQRVGIARALFTEPELLIMDEPFSALDALTREKMGFDLLDIWHQRPQTVLFITHSISEAVLLADRVIVLSPRPATITQDLLVNLPRPRNIETIGEDAFSMLTSKESTF